MAASAEPLLERFAPRLVYDSQENYFADSPAVMVESPDVQLQRADGTVIAPQPLTLEFLGPRQYANGEPVRRGDRLSIATRDYLNASRRVRDGQPEYANRMYGRAVEDPNGALWLQYWFFYFYDSARAGPIVAGNHEGDWEMLQLRMAGQVPDVALYAQRSRAVAKPWGELTTVPGTERPVCFVGGGSHTCYFEQGRHWTGVWFDRADGNGPTVDPALEVLGDELPGWVTWPGVWGGTAASGPLDAASPRGPAAHAQWGDPARLLEAAGDAGPAPEHELPVPEISIAGDGTLHYEFPADADVAALAVTVSVAGQPATYTFPVDQPKGELTLPETPAGAYVLTVSAVSSDGDVGEATTLEVGAPTPEPEPDEPAPSPPAVRDTLAGYVADTAEGPDRLNIMADVRSLATVVAAKSVDPPLSIGLFGEWGSGKSFFMGKMREHVDRLQEDTRAAGGESAYCGHIRQIVFNAWHYADANLWASLVTHIFESLAGEGDDRERLAALLKTTAVQRAHASDRLEAAVAEHDAAQEELDAVLAVRAGHQARGARLSPRAVGELIEDRDIQAAAEQLTTRLGGDAVDVGTLGDVSRELSHTVTRLPYVWRLLRKHPGWIALTVLVIAALVAVAVYLGSAIAAALAVIAPLIALLAAPVRTVLAAAEEAERASERLDRRLAEAEDAARSRRDAADARSFAAADELNDIASGQALFRFVEDRAHSADYRDYLGLIALVRRDFEALTAQMSAGGGVAIDRVVLYIDDLDRCSIQRVVEVLEAVHLLLAFKLFVVVVAVDPRWLVQSLNHRYAEQLGTDESTQTPEDYLEKIFQIPFSLQRMDDTGYGRLVAGMFPAPEDEAGETEAAAEGGSAAETPELRALDRSLTGVTTSEPVDLHPENLLVTEQEIEFMRSLAGFIQTPREAKRLANTYRLIRATLSGDALKSFTEDGHRAVLVLLAVMIGERDLAARFLARAAMHGTWSDLVSKVRGDGDLLGLGSRLDVLPIPEAFDQLQAWAPRVARYSFTSPP